MGRAVCSFNGFVPIPRIPPHTHIKQGHAMETDSQNSVPVTVPPAQGDKMA